MSRKDIKGHWLVLGLVCLGLTVLLEAQRQDGADYDIGPVSDSGSVVVSVVPKRYISGGVHRVHDMAIGAATPELSTQEQRHMHESAPYSEEGRKTSTATLLGQMEGPFLNLDAPGSFDYLSDADKEPVHFGEYIDPEGDPLSTLANDAITIERSRLSAGKYLDPDPDSLQSFPLNDKNIDKPPVQAGMYIDPDAEPVESSSEDVLNPKHVGEFIDTAI